MVHALELIHRLLTPGGILIDIHPTGIPPRIEINTPQYGSKLAGNLNETDDFIEYHQADEAVAMIIESGLFALEKQTSFEYDIFADEVGELVEYLAENWKDSLIEPQVLEQIRLLIENAAPGKPRIVIRDTIWINVLRSREFIRDH